MCQKETNPAEYELLLHELSGAIISSNTTQSAQSTTEDNITTRSNQKVQILEPNSATPSVEII